MLNKLEQFVRQYRLIEKGDTVICAVSGGADSMALLMGMYLLREKLGITVEAAHFNHCLRGAESDEDEQFVCEFCQGLSIKLYCGRQQVVAGKKGLEAAARDARYAFFAQLEGKIATAHTADDNAETVLMHLVRGTGLKGLGAIAPVRGNIIRPMLRITREQVLSFLDSYYVSYRTDRSNQEDAFLRNRLRHHVMPLLKEENPRFAENVSAMALRLREDEAALSGYAAEHQVLSVTALRALPVAVRNRVLFRFLQEQGIKEAEAEHLALTERLVFSDNPSAEAWLPGNIRIYRQYDQLLAGDVPATPHQVSLNMPGEVDFGPYQIRCIPANELNGSALNLRGQVIVRSRQSGDRMRLAGGSASLKKICIDRKIPANHRALLPVVCDADGIVTVGEIGCDLDHKAISLPAWQIIIEKQNG